jgi:zinc/manganese transport system substrate-binding protein
LTRITIITSILLIAVSANAKIRIVATYPYIADLAKRIGGDMVDVQALSPGNWDPHTVVPRPSYIAKVRNADLLIINGAELEIGWIPPIIRESRNNKVQPGAPGFLDLSAFVQLIEVPATVSRAMGDVHPSGNHHFYLDPENIPKITEGICRKLCTLDDSYSLIYTKNCNDFIIQWRNKEGEWSNKLMALKGMKVIQYHRLFDYFFQRYGIIDVMEIEPLPGIPPGPGYIDKVIGVVRSQSVVLIVTDMYHPMDVPKYIASRTGTRLIVLPHDVHSLEGVTDIFLLYEEITRGLTGH